MHIYIYTVNIYVYIQKIVDHIMYNEPPIPQSRCALFIPSFKLLTARAMTRAMTRASAIASARAMTRATAIATCDI